jgi:phosphoribosylaminoimidazolecarboxamide formyltransferase/IMP cyclohydrolase
VELAQALARNGMPIYATGGTQRHLTGHGIEAYDIAELTGFPSLFDGRLKSLHPQIFGAILADRDNPVHQAEAREHGIPHIAVVAVNLYPFEATVARGASFEEAIEQIDIGGPSLIRASAKNYKHVSVLVDPQQYRIVIDALPGGPDEAARRVLATQAFERTAEYDASIARYLEAGLVASELPGSLALGLPLATPLRYGENPQDRAAFYLSRTEQLPEQLHGKALSYNNLLDLDATLQLLSRGVPEGLGPASPSAVRAAIVKHTVPCGVAERETATAAIAAALAADPVSAYGGIIAVDGNVDRAGAAALSEFFLEIVAAPSYDDAALEILRRKKNLRVMRYDPRLPQRLKQELRVRSALGGVLAEDQNPAAAPEAWRVVSRREPSPGEWRDLRFAWDIVRHVKSNGVVIVRDGISRGICAGCGRGLHGRDRAGRLDPRRAGDRRGGRARCGARLFKLPLLFALAGADGQAGKRVRCGPSAAYRACRARLRRTRLDAAAAAGHPAHGRHSDRFGQCARAFPLLAALLAPGRLRSGRSRPARVHAAAIALRILGT